MPVSDIFKLAKDNAGRQPGITVKGEPTLSEWIIDARADVSSFDVLVAGDSNTMFLDNVGDTVNGIIDGLESGFETIGLKTYGSPIYWAGCVGTQSYSKYFQTFVPAAYNDGTDAPGGGVATVERGQLDADADYASFRTDLNGPTNDKYSIALSTGNYPNNPPDGTRVSEDFIKFETGNRNTNVGDVLKVGASASWPLIKEQIVGRFIYTRHPNNSSGWQHFIIWDSQDSNSSVSNPVDLRGSAGYGVHERTLVARANRNEEVAIAVGGAGLGFQNYNGKAGFVFFSMHSKKIGVCVSSIYARGGATSTDLNNNLNALVNHNNNIKLKTYLAEVVNRQKSANVKNFGRVCIVIQIGRNTTPGANEDVQVSNLIIDLQQILNNYKNTWLSLGYPMHNLCFLVFFSPVFSPSSTVNYESKAVKAINNAVGRLGNNVTVIEHSKNLSYADYITNTLWNVDNQATGSAIPNAHLTDNGYITLGKRIASNLALYFRSMIKRKK